MAKLLTKAVIVFGIGVAVGFAYGLLCLRGCRAPEDVRERVGRRA